MYRCFLLELVSPSTLPRQKCYLFVHSWHLNLPCLPGFLLMSEFRQEIDVWNNRPLPVPARLQVINSVLISKRVYRLKCIPIVWDLLLKTQRWLKVVLLAIVGLPTFLCN